LVDVRLLGIAVPDPDHDAGLTQLPDHTDGPRPLRRDRDKTDEATGGPLKLLEKSPIRIADGVGGMRPARTILRREKGALQVNAGDCPAKDRRLLPSAGNGRECPRQAT
jgi:hypothetical protein